MAKEQDKTISPRTAAWRRFKRNIMGMTAIVFIIAATILAIFAYCFIPDKTPHANRQLLEIGTMKPGFHVNMLILPKENPPEKPSFFRRLLYGCPDPHLYIPFDSIVIDSAHTRLYHFNPEPCEHPQYSTYDNYSIAERTFNTAAEAQSYITQHCVINRRFLLGTDQFGRDFLSRLILGSRVSLGVGFIAVLLSLIIGIVIGGIGGFFRGKVDDIVVWLINVTWSIPTLLLVIAITFALGKGITQVFIAVGLTMWVEIARIVRGQILSIREVTFVEASKALGFHDARIIIRHILPNIINPIIVVSAANFATSILLEAGLSFLGIGVQPPMPSWGSMIKENYAFIILDSAYLALLPGVAIMLLVLAFMLVGNALRESFDVKRQR